MPLCSKDKTRLPRCFLSQEKGPLRVCACYYFLKNVFDRVELSVSLTNTSEDILLLLSSFSEIVISNLKIVILNVCSDLYNS